MLPTVLRELNIANDIDTMLWLSYVLTLACVQSKVHIDPPFGSGWQFLSEGNKEWTIIDKGFFSAEKLPVLPLIVPVVAAAEEGVVVPVIALIPELQFHTVITAKFSVISVNPLFKVVIVPVDAALLSDLVPLLPVLPILLPVLVSESVSKVILPLLPLTPALLDLIKTEPISAGSSIYPDAYLPSVNYDVEQLSRDFPQQLYRTELHPNDFISCPEDWPHSVYTSVKTCGLSGYMRYDKQ